MPFDTKQFHKTKFKARTEDVPVPDLAGFFPDGESPVWTVRGLTGKEVGISAEAVSKNKNLTAVVDALASTVQAEKVQGLKDALGIGKVPDDIAKRIAHLEAGSVSPKCDTELALKICEHFPIIFYELTNVILKLTGQGAELGKPVASTQTPESEAA
jgi:hypothetical protein